MGLFDKFMSSMNMDDDEYYDDYDDEEFDDDDDYEDEPPRRASLFGGFGKGKKSRQVEDDYDDFEDLPKSSSGRQVPAVANNKVTPMPRSRKGGMEVVVIKPTSMDDAREIADTLLAGRTVVLNMEGLDMDIAQRIIDFASGACYALSGNLQKIANYIFIITPANVDISGDFQNLLSGAFGGGMSTINTPGF